TFDPFSNLIEVYINRVRRKIDADAAKPLLHTRRGVGYVLGSAEDLTSTDQGEESTSPRPRVKTPPARKNHAWFDSHAADPVVHGRARAGDCRTLRSGLFHLLAERRTTHGCKSCRTLGFL